MTDLYIFKKPGSVGGEQADYQMYVLFEEGILLFNDISRRMEPHQVHDFQAEQLLLSGISDCRNGILMVDVICRRAQSQEEHSIHRFKGHQTYMTKHELEGDKEMIYFFKEYVVEVKTVTKGIANQPGSQTVSQLSIYDFKNQITMYWNPPANGNILDV